MTAGSRKTEITRKEESITETTTVAKIGDQMPDGTDGTTPVGKQHMRFDEGPSFVAAQESITGRHRLSPFPVRAFVSIVICTGCGQGHAPRGRAARTIAPHPAGAKQVAPLAQCGKK